jgi:hypothetical protein
LNFSGPEDPRFRRRLRWSRPMPIRLYGGSRKGGTCSPWQLMAYISAGVFVAVWLTSSRLRKPLQDDVPYTTRALKQNLTRVQIAWDECQASRARKAIYGYLSAVFDLAMWWMAEDRG